MEEYIFVPDKKTTKDNQQNEYYTLYGKHNQLDEYGQPVCNSTSPDLLAKTTLAGDKKTYWVKVGEHGRVYNPIGMYSEGKHNKFTNRSGKNEFEFRKVNKKVFDFYVNFLRTKNLAWLHNAEREMI